MKSTLALYSDASIVLRPNDTGLTSVKAKAGAGSERVPIGMAGQSPRAGSGTTGRAALSLSP
jgi:hypothetical protein